MAVAQLSEVNGERLTFHFHPGQWRAWQSERRFILVLAGTQSGKTSFGPAWLWREIQRCGPGDYMVVTPTFPLLELKALPELLRLFDATLGLGRYIGSPVRRFVFSTEGSKRTFGAAYDPYQQTSVIFGYAAEPESLESATAKAAWLDEAGQRRFKLASFEAILRRLSLAQGRILATTTPYDLGWVKQRLYDRWKAGDPDIDVIQFDSTQNPAFSRVEFERAQRDLPRWKFNMFYRGQFERPAGLIYDSFATERHTCPPFAIPAAWPRYVGLDFGGVNTAAVFLAEEPATRRLYLYRTYKAGSRTASDHARALLAGEPGLPVLAVGGSKSEGQWRAEFAAGGLPIREPLISDVEVGIDRVYGTISRGELVVFSTLANVLEEIATYSRVLDDAGEPTEKIEDKETFHHLDSLRYIVGYIRNQTGTEFRAATGGERPLATGYTPR
jgi:hypothetical protein